MTNENFTDRDYQTANSLRILAADMVQEANSGHPGLPLGTADIVTVLWTRYMVNNPADPNWFNRDRFVLSAGHGSALLYALLHLSGYPLSLEELKNFRQWGSHTAGHPEYEPEIGIETTTGPLGQGFGNAVGIALAEQLLAARFNKPGFPIINHFTYVLASDGDLMEGISHETASLAGHLGLSRLIVFYDDNGITIDGSTDLAFSEDVVKRFEAYNWHTQQVDGHNMAEISAAIRNAKNETERPSLIACKTHIGYGSPRQDTAKVHGAPLGEEGLNKTKEHFAWPVDKKFYIPEEARASFAQVKTRGSESQTEWENLFAKYRSSHPDLAEQLDQISTGELPLDISSLLPTFSEEKPLATRVASGKVLEALSSQIPSLVGGSADLTPSNNTKPSEAKFIQRQDFSGSYIHFGVREHGMAAVMNGLALHNLRPYGGTFLVFSDYMRPSIRLAAMMGLPVIYIFTHDSIGLGEDGPTHQPVEHILSLRAIPNLVVIRPADANETSAAWKVAIERKSGPTALLLSRQGLPVITPVDDGLAKGAYVLKDTDGKGPDIVLIATGSEVALALEAQKELSADNIACRVVSMPSWELFAAQSAEYQKSVLPPDIPRLAIEAGVTLAWNQQLYPNGSINSNGVIGIDRFGASAPYKVLFEQFGFSTENIIRTAKRLLQNV
ncbi:MAG: transketolase [Anaerolineales bacterium]|nr:transketolase [Anaerolineales bacterium]